MTPEQKARISIDKKIEESGYILQDYKAINPRAGLGVVVREFPTQSGPVDYLIFIEGKPVGVIEAKADDKGEILLSVSEQAKRYAESGLKYGNDNIKIRFAYIATSIRTAFIDYTDDARTREEFSFHRPETLHEKLKDELTLRKRMRKFPQLERANFRDCQIRAILNLEKSFGHNYPRALIQMATGAGKTYTAITSAYRLLKHAKAKRVLFLVDTKNLGKQAEQEFRSYKPYDDSRSFPELYKVGRLNTSAIPSDIVVCISTIQRMYSILRGEEMDESAEQHSFHEVKIDDKPREVVYNPSYPPEFFDIIIIDSITKM